MNDRPELRKPLSLREYLGVFAPARPRTRAEGETRPLSTREYLAALPNVDDFIAFAKWIGRGSRRLLSRIRH